MKKLLFMRFLSVGLILISSVISIKAQVKKSQTSLSVEFAKYIPFDSVHGVYVIPVQDSDTIYGYNIQTKEWLFGPIYDSLANNFQGNYKNGIDFYLNFKEDTIYLEVRRNGKLRYFLNTKIIE